MEVTFIGLLELWLRWKVGHCEMGIKSKSKIIDLGVSSCEKLFVYWKSLMG